MRIKLDQSRRAYLQQLDAEALKLYDRLNPDPGKIVVGKSECIARVLRTWSDAAKQSDQKRS